MKKIIFHADDYGRSPSISKNIYKCINDQKISSISIIVSEKIHGLKLLKKTRVAKRLHLNLTDFTQNKSKDSYIYNLSFMKLLFMPFLPNFVQNKKKIKNEIIRQIEIYKKKLNQKKIFLDSHQHIHMIPWIFNIIFNLRKKYKITNIRIPNEKFFINYVDLFNLNIQKNIIKFIIIKSLIFLSKKKIKKIKYNYFFFGILYSGIQNPTVLKRIIKKIKNEKTSRTTEILLHPGFAIKSEIKLFNKDFYKYYISYNRKKEFKMTKSLP